MISRATTRIVGEIYQAVFSGNERNENYRGRYGFGNEYYWTNFKDKFYDYLFDRDYDTWFCNRAQHVRYDDKRAIKELIMKLHTGEAVEKVTPDWTQTQREVLGQRFLADLATDILNSYSTLRYSSEHYTALTRSLELDGYEYKDGKLLFLETAVLDDHAEAGVLENLYKTLKLDNADITLHHLKLSSENYLTGHWGDAISNARCFLEHTLREIYVSHNLEKNNAPCNPNVYSRPVEVRQYLEREGLIELKEAKAIAEIYGLLSNTGSHPYIAEKDQARLMRHLALTFSQFAMLRYQGYLKSKGK